MYKGNLIAITNDRKLLIIQLFIGDDSEVSRVISIFRTKMENV